jgi:hypothetical protein
MSIPSKTEIEKSIIELSNDAKLLDQITLWRAIIPIDPTLDKFVPDGERATSYIPLYEWQELKMFVWSFKKLLKDAEDDIDLQVRIMMIVYCHIFEADFAFAVIWNLLRALKGLPESWIFSRESKKGNISVCEYPSQKIPEIQILASDQELTIGDILDRLWNANLRNSFSHSQYRIFGDTILFTKNLSPISRSPSLGMPRGTGELKVKDLQNYYLGGCALIDVFDREYNNLYKLATLQNNGIETDSR